MAMNIPIASRSLAERVARMRYSSAMSDAKKMPRTIKLPKKQSQYWDGLGTIYTGYGRYKRRGAQRRSYNRFKPRSRRFRGRGGYWDDAWGKIGGLFGGYKPGSEESGVAVGQGVWDAGKAAIISGLGAYGTNNVIDQGVPSISNPGGSDGCITIRHKEYVGDVTSNSSAAFQLLFNGLRINPGNPLLFPWLSQIANNFSQYKLCGMLLHYKPTSGALSTTQSLGEIVMACNYNPAETAFVNKQQMLNEIMAVSKVPCQDFCMGVECNPDQTMNGGLLYVCNGTVPSGQDSRFYDHGKLYVACQGIPATTSAPVGELWVSYQFEFYKPNLSSLGPNNTPQGYVYHARNTGYTNANPLGANNSGLITYVDNIGVTVTPTALQIAQNGAATGNYVLLLLWSGSSTACTVPTVTGSQACATGTLGYFNGGSDAPTGALTTSQCYRLSAFAYTAVSAGLLTIGAAGTLPTAGNTVEIFMFPSA